MSGFGWIRTLPRWVALAAAMLVAAATFAAWKLDVFTSGISPAAVAQSQPAANPAAPSGGAAGAPELELADQQQGSIKIGPVGEHVFPLQKQAVGSIDFNEDMSVQVFTPYQGKIIAAFA